MIMAKKGRNKEMTARRDAKVAARFVYWTEVQRLRSDDAIKHMAMNEFFLSEVTLMEIIKKVARDNGDKRRVVFPNPKLPKFSNHDMKLYEGET